MGSIWKKLVTVLRGRTEEVADVGITPQTLLELDQHLHEAEAHMDVTRSSLAGLVAKNAAASRQLDDSAEQVATLTRSAGVALAEGREDLALEAAGRIGKLERVMEDQARIAKEYSKGINSLRSALQASRDRLEGLKSQLEAIRASDLVHQARSALSSSGHDSTAQLRLAASTLDDMRERQLACAAQMQAQEEILNGDEGLERRLREAGITSESTDAAGVLDRVKSDISRSA